jgi:hypothetical protein
MENRLRRKEPSSSAHYDCSEKYLKLHSGDII